MNVRVRSLTLIILATLCAACSRANPRVSIKTRAAVETRTLQILVASSALEGENVIAIASRMSGGAWIVTESDAGIALRPVDPDGTVGSSLMLLASPQGQIGSQISVVDAGDERVFVGAGMTVFDVHFQQGAVKSFALPAEPIDPGATSYLPSVIQNTQSIRALAYRASDASLFAALSNSRNIAQIDTGMDSVSSVALPASLGDADTIAILSDGTIGVSVHDYSRQALDTLALGDGSGSWHLLRVNAAAFLIGSGDHFVTGAGSFTALTSSDTIGSETFGSVHFLISPSPVSAGTNLVAPTKSGVVVVTPAGQSTPYDFSSVHCNPDARSPTPSLGPANATPTTTSSPQTCQPGAALLAGMSNGHAYVVSTAGDIGVV